VQAYFACYNVDVRIARIFNVYGPGMTRFAIYDFWRKISQNRECIEILGDGEQLRDYLFLDDAVQAIITIAANGVAGEDYNVASGIPIHTADLARQVAACMGVQSIDVTTLGRSFPGDIPRWYADVRKLTSLGFCANTNLTTGLELTIQSLEAAVHLPESY
jgi:UDP-glucose 4-epimerase